VHKVYCSFNFLGKVIIIKDLSKIILFVFLLGIGFFACGDSDNTEQNFYNNWVETGPGLSKDVEKNVLTEFVGSTKCPYCPLSDSLLVSYFNPDHQNYVGSDVTKKWFIINYHTYHPSAGDPLYEFLRGGTAEEDFCYIRFGEGGQGEWYNVGGVPTVYTNGQYSSVSQNMYSYQMDQKTPVSINLEGSSIDGPIAQVRVSISSSTDLSQENSLYLFIAATLDSVNYKGYNGQKHHEGVFLGWINDGLEGELLSLENKEYTKSYLWEMPNNYPQNNQETSWTEVDWDIKNLKIIAFLQNKSSKEILQVQGFK